tara:strand:+ start:160 stop:540 length:381 start_codon:yes stop_codon:yes gene_type:complete
VETIIKTKKEQNMKNTENEIKALHLVNQSIFDNGWSWESDPKFGSEHWEWVTLPQMIELLVDSGWTVKSAEGTIGSIIDKGKVFDDSEQINDIGEKIYSSSWTNVYNDENDVSAEEAETLTNKGVA